MRMLRMLEGLGCRITRAAQAAQRHFEEVKEGSLAEPGTWAYPGYVETGHGALNQARATALPACLRKTHVLHRATCCMHVFAASRTSKQSNGVTGHQ